MADLTGTSSIPDIEVFGETPGKPPAAKPQTRHSVAIAPTTKNDIGDSSAARGFWSLHGTQPYYTSSGRKVADFFVGLIGIPFALVLLGWLGFVVYMWAAHPTGFLAGLAELLIIIVVAIVVALVLLILSFVFGRKWVGFGLLIVCALVLAIVVSAIGLF